MDFRTFELDMAEVVESATAELRALIDLHGMEKALRIFGCDLAHHPGVTCICGGTFGEGASAGRARLKGSH